MYNTFFIGFRISNSRLWQWKWEDIEKKIEIEKKNTRDWFCVKSAQMEKG